MKEKAKLYRSILGKEIQLARQAKGYTVEYVAETMGIKPNTVRNIEWGKFGVSIDFIVMLSMILEHEFKVIPQHYKNVLLTSI